MSRRAPRLPPQDSDPTHAAKPALARLLDLSSTSESTAETKLWFNFDFWFDAHARSLQMSVPTENFMLQLFLVRVFDSQLESNSNVSVRADLKLPVPLSLWLVRLCTHPPIIYTRTTSQIHFPASD
jgi:hypothetical protein